MNKFAVIVFSLALTWEFAEVLTTGIINGETLLPVIGLVVYVFLGVKPKKKQIKRRATSCQNVAFELKGNGWSNQ